MPSWLGNRQLQVLALLAALGAYLAGAALGVARAAGENNDFENFYGVGSFIVAEGDLPSHNPIWRYPPTAFPWIAILGVLPRSVMVFVWPVVSVSAVAAGTIAFACTMSSEPLVRFWVVVLSLLVSAPFFVDEVALGQLTTTVTAGMLLSWWLIEGRRPRLGGLLLGVLASVKIFPAGVLFYLLLKRKWAAVACGVMGVALSIALAAAVLGPGELAQTSSNWFKDAFLGRSAHWLIFRPDDDFHTGQSTNYHNQALSAVLARLLQSKNAGGFFQPLYVNVADWSPQAVWIVYLLIELGVLAALVLLWRRPWGRTPPDRRQSEFAIAVFAPLLFLPHALTYFFALTHAVTMALLLRASDPAPPARRAARAALLLWVGSFPTLGLTSARAVGVTLWAAALYALGLVVVEALRRSCQAVGSQSPRTGRYDRPAGKISNADVAASCLLDMRKPPLYSTPYN